LTEYVILVSIAETFVNAVSDERLAVVALRVLEVFVLAVFDQESVVPLGSSFNLQVYSNTA